MELLNIFRKPNALTVLLEYIDLLNLSGIIKQTFWEGHPTPFATL